jgi:hypothetical protein
VASSLQVFRPTWDLHTPSHPRLLLRIMRLFITQFSAASCYFLSPDSKYSPQHSVLKHPQSMFQPNMRNKGRPSLAWTLELWVRIPLKSWLFGVFMRLFSVCVVLCLGRGLATVDHSSKEPCCL